MQAVSAIKSLRAQILATAILVWTNSACGNLPNNQTATAAAQTTPTAIQTAAPTATTQPLSGAETPPVSKIEVPADALRGVLIRFWHPWSGSTKAAVGKLVEQFNLSNPWGILVTAVPFSGYDAINGSLMDEEEGLEQPNILAGYLHQALEWEQNHPLLDLFPYIADPEWGLSQQDIDDFYPIFWVHDQIGDRRLGIPVYRSAQLLAYNQSWADELGFTEPPASPEQFRQQTCAAAESLLKDDFPDNNGMGGWIVSTDPAVTLSWIGAFSGNVLKMPASDQNQSIYQFNTLSAQRSFAYLRGLFDRSCAWLPQAPVPDLAFASRQALAAAASSTDLAFIGEAMLDQENQDLWTVIPFPSETGSPVVNVYGPSFFALQGEAKQQLAGWLFIRWISLPENSARIIETNGAFPARKSTLEFLQPFAKRHPQWASAIELLDFAQNEPAASSWGAVRRSLGDASTQLYRSYFTVDQVEALLQYLDSFSAELHLGIDPEDVFATLTPTPGPPTRTPIPTSSPTPEPSLPAPTAAP